MCRFDSLGVKMPRCRGEQKPISSTGSFRKVRRTLACSCRSASWGRLSRLSSTCRAISAAERLFGIVPRLAREDGERTFHGVQVRRCGIEELPCPGGYVGPHQKTGTRLPGRLRDDLVVTDAGDGRSAVEDRDLTSEPFQRASCVEMGRCRERFECHMPGEVAGKDVPLRS